MRPLRPRRMRRHAIERAYAAAAKCAGFATRWWHSVAVPVAAARCACRPAQRRDLVPDQTIAPPSTTPDGTRPTDAELEAAHDVELEAFSAIYDADWQRFLNHFHPGRLVIDRGSGPPIFTSDTKGAFVCDVAISGQTSNAVTHHARHGYRT